MKRQILHSVLLAIVAMMLFALPQYAQAQTKEAYVVRSGITLTFYYDTQKATRPGTKWGIEEEHEGTFIPAWAGTDGTPNTTTTQAVFDPSFKDFRPKTTARWFNYFKALTQITGIENLNTEEVTDMSDMFAYCEALTQLDVSKFDTKNVTNIYGMFYGCAALTQLNVSKFDTKNVTDMSRMFSGCTALTQLDVSKFETENVTDMYGMFDGCAALIQLDVSKFEPNNVTDMGRMFSGCTALTQLDVSKFETKNVTNMGRMFSGCTALTRLDVSKFDTENVTDMYGMFDGCAALTQLDVTNFGTKNVTDMCNMFSGCAALIRLDVSKFDTQNVTDMSYMFSGCAALATIYSNEAWTCGNSEDMFYNCEKLKGAVSYDAGKIDVTMANPDTGYFTKKVPTGIAHIGHAATVKAVYSVDGRRLKATQPGVNIMKMSDGTTRKVVKK